MLKSNVNNQQGTASKPVAFSGFFGLLFGLLMSLLLIGGSGCSGTEYRLDEDWEKLGRFTYPGFYMGAGYSRGLEDSDISGVSVDDSTSGLNFKAGMRGSRFLALEFMYERGAFDLSALGSKFAEAQINSFSLNLKYYPTGSFEGNAARVQPYLLAGAGSAYLNTHDEPGVASGNDLDAPLAKLGIGADVYITEHLYVNGEFVRTEMFDRMKDYDFNSFNIGLNVRF